MKKTILKIYDFFGALYLNPILKLELKKRPFPIINERATEYSFFIQASSKALFGEIT
jgi:hypothetical protein